MTLANLISQYESNRILLLGSKAGLVIEQPHANPGASDFDAFVTSSYVALRETLADDASFFLRARVLRNHEATRSVTLLRTARQHGDNQDADTFYDRWLGDKPIDWDDAVKRLADQVEDYLTSLLRAAVEIRKSPILRQQWKESDSVSISSVFASVCQDLGLSFRDVAIRAKVRSIDAREKRERPTGPRRQIVADLCVQDILSESRALPVEYFELLDELGLLGSRDAPAVLALAYATSRALPELNGDAFKRKTSEMWWSLVRTRPTAL